MNTPDPAPFHIGLTPDRVVDAAAELTRTSHLMTWSLRDLAGRLGVAPSVIYHHVGGKDLLSRGVVERMLGQITMPSNELPWQQWFRTLLHSAGRCAADYPGTAKWMLMHGPTIPAVLPILEAGMAVLHHARFGAQSNVAYAVLLNNAMLTISMNDDRLQHERDGPRDHATMMAEFQKMPTASTEVRSMGEDFIRPFAEGGDTASRMRWKYYDVVVESTISGVEATLRDATLPAS